MLSIGPGPFPSPLSNLQDTGDHDDRYDYDERRAESGHPRGLVFGVLSICCCSSVRSV